MMCSSSPPSELQILGWRLTGQRSDTCLSAFSVSRRSQDSITNQFPLKCYKSRKPLSQAALKNTHTEKDEVDRQEGTAHIATGKEISAAVSELDSIFVLKDKDTEGFSQQITYFNWLC